MHFVLALLAGDPLNPDPTQSPDPSNVFHSPGIVGFLGTFILVIGAVAIIWDMVRRIRRVNYKAQIQERIAAEKAEIAAAAGGASTDASPADEPGAKASATKPSRTRPAAPPKPKRKSADDN